MSITPEETPALSGELILGRHTNHAPTDSELVELWVRNITVADGWTQLFRMRQAGEPLRRVVVYVVQDT
jgi:hypothetical protein